jgi:hypothetical protein
MTTALARFAKLADMEEPAVVEDPRVTEADLPRGLLVLAFDQSIRATGWTVISTHCRQGAEVVLASSQLTKTPEQRGWESTLADATTLALKLRDLLHHLKADLAFPIDQVVHELPIAGRLKGGKPKRPESSALAALGVRLVAHDFGLPLTALAAQSAKRLVTGDIRSEKREAHTALAQLPWLQGQDKLTNEGKRDAALLGLLWLARFAPRP